MKWKFDKEMKSTTFKNWIFMRPPMESEFVHITSSHVFYFIRSLPNVWLKCLCCTGFLYSAIWHQCRCCCFFTGYDCSHSSHRLLIQTDGSFKRLNVWIKKWGKWGKNGFLKWTKQQKWDDDERKFCDEMWILMLMGSIHDSIALLPANKPDFIYLAYVSLNACIIIISLILFNKCNLNKMREIYGKQVEHNDFRNISWPTIGMS